MYTVHFTDDDVFFMTALECYENFCCKSIRYTVHFTDDDVSFYDSPRMLIRKTANRALTAHELPC